MALARILLLQPRVLILDEPTSGLDMSVQATVLNLLLELRERFSLTYLFISHDLSVVERLSDRVAIMYLGRIVETAPAQDLFAQPTHPYTRILLAAAPRLTGRRADHIVVRGDPPNATAIHAGCAFADRCPIVAPVCRGEVPRLSDIAPAHHVACHMATLSPTVQCAARRRAEGDQGEPRCAVPPERLGARWRCLFPRAPCAATLGQSSWHGSCCIAAGSSHARGARWRSASSFPLGTTAG